MTRLLPLLALLLAAAAADAEIYKWTDANGRVHFGDSATAAREGGKAEAVTPPAPARPGGNAGAAPGGDAREIRARQRRILDALQQDQAERERDAREQAETRQRRDQDCRRLRQELASMDGRPVYIPGEGGERQFLDDQQRKDYVDKANALLAEHCE